MTSKFLDHGDGKQDNYLDEENLEKLYDLSL